MPRPRSDDKRAAKEAGVSNGSLFTYFDTKADLLNRLYLELKTDMGAAALGGLPAGDDVREQMLHMWSRWLHWATAYPEKRRALAQLEVSDEITASTHQAASQALTGIAGILERSRENGPMRDVPLAFVVGLASALADTTIDFIIRDPDDADTHGRTSFDALWRMIA